MLLGFCGLVELSILGRLVVLLWVLRFSLLVVGSHMVVYALDTAADIWSLVSTSSFLSALGLRRLS